MDESYGETDDEVASVTSDNDGAAIAATLRIAMSERASRAVGPRAGRVDEETAEIAAKAQLAVFDERRVVARDVDSPSMRRATSRPAGMRGHGIHADVADEQRSLDRVLGLKRRNAEACNLDPPRKFKRAAQCNCVGSARTFHEAETSESKGTTQQYTRFNYGEIDRAYAAQCMACSLAHASVRYELRSMHAEIDVGDPLAPLAFNPAVLVVPHTAVSAVVAAAMKDEPPNAEDTELDPLSGLLSSRSMAETSCKIVCVLTHTSNAYDTMTARLGTGRLFCGAKALAQAQLQREAISTKFGRNTYELDSMCRGTVGLPIRSRMSGEDAGVICPLWSGNAVINYALSHPRGREVIREVAGQLLTDFDINLAILLETIGRSEITRRENDDRAKHKAALRKVQASQEAAALQQNAEAAVVTARAGLDRLVQQVAQCVLDGSNAEQQVEDAKTTWAALAADDSAGCNTDLHRQNVGRAWETVQFAAREHVSIASMVSVNMQRRDDCAQVLVAAIATEKHATEQATESSSIASIAIAAHTAERSAVTELQPTGGSLVGGILNTTISETSNSFEAITIANAEMDEETRANIRGAYAGLDSPSTKNFWWHVLSRSEHSHVLLTLVSSNPLVTEAAAMQGLRRQARGQTIADQDEVKKVCGKHALHVSGSVARMVMLEADASATPTAVLLGVRTTKAYATAAACNRTRNVFGYRIKENHVSDAHIVAMRQPSLLLEFPPPDPLGLGIAIMWGVSDLQLARVAHAEHRCPAIGELSALRAEFQRDKTPTSFGRGLTNPRGSDWSCLAAMERFLPSNRFVPKLPELSPDGPVSIITIRMGVRMYKRDRVAIDGLLDEAQSLIRGYDSQRHVRPDGTSPGRTAGAAWTIRESTRVPCEEPLVQPGSKTQLSLRLLHVLTHLHSPECTTSGRACRHTFCTSEDAADAPGDPTPASYDAMPILPIRHVAIERVGALKPIEGGGPHDGYAPIAVSLHAAVQAPVRLLDVVRTLGRDVSFGPRRVYPLTRMLLVAANHASYVGDVGRELMAETLNNAIDSSRAATHADYNTWLGATVADAWMVQRTPVDPTAAGSAYEGNYPSKVDYGQIPGLRARNIFSDHRHHGCTVVPQELANEQAHAYASARQVDCGDGTHARRPAALCGMTRLTPGLHAYMDPYTDALEDVRKHCGRDGDGVDDILINVFTAHAQALRPQCPAGTNDGGSRISIRPSRDGEPCPTGVAKQLDATHENDAIVCPPLFHPPAAESAGDNPFETCYDELDTFYNVSYLIAWYAFLIALPPDVEVPDGNCGADSGGIPSYPCHSEAEAQQITNELHKLICAFHDGEPPPRDGPGMSHVYASDVCCLMCSAYPPQHAVNQMLCHPAYARVQPYLHSLFLKSTSPHGSELPALPTAIRSVFLDRPYEAARLIDSARRRWRGFNRHSGEGADAWHNGWAPLIQHALVSGGVHPRNASDTKVVRDLLVGSVHAALHAYAEDEEGYLPPAPPCPCAGVRSAAEMKRSHIEPVYTERQALIGIAPSAYRQQLVLIGSARTHDPNDRSEDAGVQQWCVIGQLRQRLSSDINTLNQHGRMRTKKATCPLQRDKLSEAFGGVRKRQLSCAYQRLAWGKNTRKQCPFFLNVSMLRPRDYRSRGSRDRVHALHSEAEDARRAGSGCYEDQAALNLMQRGASSIATAKCRHALDPRND